MQEIEALIKKALKYKESGLTELEIADELNVSKETAVWLLSKGKEKKPVGDLKIGWRSIGVYPSRISFISDALCDIIVEECEDADAIVGIAINGIPYATFIADKLGLELSIFRPHHEKSGAFSSNYASVKGKKVVLVDDVVGTGNTFKSALKAIKAEKGETLLCLAVLNKRSQNSIDGVPLRALIRARVI
ncbi:MAG: orotate phosphoribosyltransferase-like protein [Thermoplasmata archaeon]|nr:MAG: orotate phosphoribosyltransferase-like protein [Thermoplasmata archaeon]RLF31309.1 MAG: orotate phosphoribosyltransferase-like protein [Thermoplasmata archaeon]RLF52320.1 MAG: orotate phosphoribosyltransferase-like protein [Thermoplasmata archaeon]